MDVSGDAEFAGQPQTVYDFVVALVNDAAARAAFIQDPAAALAGANLQDITAQDVQEVLPLVLDYGIAGAHGAVNSTPVVSDVVAQLGAAISAVGLETDAGALTADLDNIVAVNAVDSLANLDGIAGVTAEGSGAGVVGAVTSAVGGVNLTGDAGVEGATAALNGVSGVATGGLTGELGAEGGNLGAGVDSVLGHVGLDGGVGLSSSGGGVGVDTLAGTLQGGVEAASGELAAGLDVTPAVGEGGVVYGEVDADGLSSGIELGGNSLGLDGGLDVGAAEADGGIAVNTPLGVYGLDAEGGARSSQLLDVHATDDLATALDSDIVGRAAEGVSGAVAGVAVAGEAALSGDVSVAMSHMAHATAPSAPDAAGAVREQVDLDDLPMNLPAAGELKGAVQEHVGNLQENLPVDLPAGPQDVQSAAGQHLGDLPAPDLASDLPVDLPVANPLPSDVPVASDVQGSLENVGGQVQDAVADSPVGGAIQDGAEHLQGLSQQAQQFDIG